MMDYHDLNEMINHSKSNLSTKNFSHLLGPDKRRLKTGDYVGLCMVESVIGHLNKKDCLKKLPKFQYLDDEF
jgi:hypothetical protein